MAVEALPLDSALVVKYQLELTPAGAPVVRQKGLNGVKHDATEEDLYDVAEALFSLVNYPVLQVLLRKNFELNKE